MVNSLSLDVGSQSVKAVWLRESRGQLEVAAALRADAGPDAVKSLLSALKKQGAPVKSMTLGIPGEYATLRYNLLPPVPPWRLELILKYEAEELAEKSGEALTYSYTKLEIPESAVEDQILLIGLGKDVPVGARIREVEEAGGKVSRAVPAGIALFHAYRASRPGAEENVLLADIGAQETQIVLVLGGRLVFARTANFGGNQIDDLIANALNIKAEMARKVKEGTGKDAANLLEGAQNVVRSALGQLYSILQSSVTFCRTQVKLKEARIDKVLLSGGASRLPILRGYLEERFQIPVDFLKLEVGGNLPGNPGDWAIAIGLAAAQLDRRYTLIDLLPPVPRKKRDFRERTIFLFGAAAALLFSLALYFGIGAYLNGQVGAQTALIENAEAEIRSMQRQCAEADDANSVVQARLDKVHREILQTTFTAQILQALRVVVPTAISIDKISSTVLPNDAGEVLEVIVEGKADDSDRKAIDNFKQLKEALGRMPRVRRVVYEIGEVQQGNRAFKLVLSPDKEPPKKGARS